MSASSILTPVRVRDETIPWIKIKSELQPLDSWDVPRTDGAMKKHQNSSHPRTNAANLGLLG